MRNYIILNGKNSTDISGLLIQSLAPITKPALRTQVETSDGRDGDIVTSLGYAAYDKKISIAKLCSIAGMSKAALMQNFHKATGTTPLQYQLQLKIAEAVILLRSTSKSISEIAMETGFSDTNYFGRQFKRITGSSPGAYRKLFYGNSGVHVAGERHNKTVTNGG